MRQHIHSHVRRGNAGAVAPLHLSLFNGAAVHLSAYTPDEGPAWTQFRDVGNRLRTTGTGDLWCNSSLSSPHDALGLIDVTTANYRITAQVDATTPATNQEFIIVFRADLPTSDREWHFLQFDCNLGKAWLRKFDGGVTTNKESVPGDGTFVVEGNVIDIELIVEGTNVSYVISNGTQVRSIGPVGGFTDWQASQYCGIGIDDTVFRCSFFRVDQL